MRGRLAIAATLFIAALAPQRPVFAQDAPMPKETHSRIATAATFLAGGALGLGMHESGHLVFDGIFGAGVGVKRVTGAGIPFFAITHDPVSPVREFTISSAGFWVQHATDELLLTRRPRLRHEHAPLAKGVLAFNILTSVVYAGAAFSRQGPVERDTRGIAVAANIAEPWVGGLILTPATLDALRYVKPESRTLRWASRAVKIGGVLLAVKAGS